MVYLGERRSKNFKEVYLRWGRGLSTKIQLIWGIVGQKNFMEGRRIVSD